MSNITLTARCHCSFASFTLTLPSSVFPLKSCICHCNSCRHATGQLFATFAVMASSIPPPDFSNLKSYASSPGLTRYSCPKCGAYIANVEPEEWEFATGILTITSTGTNTGPLLDRVQIWIEDTRDGGASIWLKPGPGRGINSLRHLRDRNSAEATDEIIEEISRQQLPPPSSSPGRPRKLGLEASCHCGSVNFIIQPPAQDPQHKYEGLLDACTSCRLATGFEITAWVRVPLTQIFTTPDGKQQYPISRENEALNHYSSSEGVHRYSCAKCTAGVCYLNDKLRESEDESERGIVDVCAGILRSESGARAEEGVEWESRVYSAEDAREGMGEGLVDALREGLRSGADG